MNYFDTIPTNSICVLGMRITPALADRWLQLYNIDNRPLRPNIVKFYSEQMAKGNWKVSGEPISFSYNKQLTNGQHRLTAVVVSGVPIQSDVRFGLDPSAYSVIDTTFVRQPGDVLTHDGETYTKNLASTLRLLHLSDNGDAPTRKGTKGRVAVADLKVALARFPQARTGAKLAHACNHVVPYSLAGYYFTLFSLVDADLATVFFESLAKGLNLHADDPLYQLRDRLIRNRTSKAKLLTVEIAALIVKAWNASIEGVKLSNLRWRSTGESPEKFPVISGLGTVRG